ncbi:MAG: glutamine-hydrolyzing GMP synthase [Firmicutes bacterium]|nr:glutamine-hydrolyzing GMP synthase [Bacillota bacterium]
MSGAARRRKVVVLDFGAQYAQLICRRVREAGVYAELWPHDAPGARWEGSDVAAIILSGGPESVYAEGAPRVDTAAFVGRPVLGICYGMQLLAHLLGGRVVPGAVGEYGRARLTVEEPLDLFHGLPPSMDVWMSHGDHVVEPPPGFRVLARSEAGVIAAVGDPERRWYGVQFHPEVTHTPGGTALIRNFLFRVAGLRAEWTPASFIDEAVERIRQQVGEGRAIAALSGGVDSMVAAALVHRAIGERLTAVFVDHGLLREGEAEEVRRLVGGTLGMPLKVVDARQRFLDELRGVVDPEEKRRRIGRTFIELFEAATTELGGAEFLVQGTLYPDVVESGRGAADVIKTHHNVGGLPERMRLRLVEPLRELFKDEVRAVGRQLGLPEAAVMRQPFPGPGLAVRIVGEVTAERLRVLRAADAIVRAEVERAGLARGLWQYFAVLTGAHTVGVKGDRRAYGETVAVRAVTSEDAMTADWAELPHEVLKRIADRITAEVPGCTRVVYDITSKPPGTIEWE